MKRRVSGGSGGPDIENPVGLLGTFSFNLIEMKCHHEAEVMSKGVT